MLERSVPVLRIVCLALSALVLVQLAWLAVRKDPLAGFRVPPALTAAAESPAPPKPPPTNAPPSKGPARAPRPGPSMPLPGAFGPPVGPSLADLPVGIQGRIERITQSEILGPVMRPPPMALMGIGGDYAFLRGPDGQTGLLREGEQLGSIKLLQIGTNRVLIEQDGQKQELSIFAGFGSETLLPKAKDNPQ